MHVEAGERADMRDAAAHLSRADHADLANVERHAVRLNVRSSAAP